MWKDYVETQPCIHDNQDLQKNENQIAFKMVLLDLRVLFFKMIYEYGSESKG